MRPDPSDFPHRGELGLVLVARDVARKSPELWPLSTLITLALRGVAQGEACDVVLAGTLSSKGLPLIERV